MDTEKPAQLVAIDELRSDAKTPEDHAYLDAEQAKIEAERKQALGGDVIETAHLVQLQDGSVATEQELQESKERGEEASSVYNGNRR